MWPLENKRDVLRIGCHCVELWNWRSRGMVLNSRQTIESNGTARSRGLAEALAGLLGARSVEHRKAQRGVAPVDVVIESAWLPVLTFEPRPMIWSRIDCEALLRHRLTSLYSDASELNSDWLLEVDYLPGDALGIGFGLASSIKEIIESISLANGQVLSSLRPSWCWGWAHLTRYRRTLRKGWWFWLEQDRALIGCVRGGRLSSLNTGAHIPIDAGWARRQIEQEAVRRGMRTSSEQAVIAGWQLPFSAVPVDFSENGLRCVSVNVSEQPLPVSCSDFGHKRQSEQA